MLGAATLVGVKNVAASGIEDPDDDGRDNGVPDEFPGIGDPNSNSARDLTPGFQKGFDPQPEPPGRDSSARDLAPGQTEIGDPHVVAPGNLKKLIKPGE